MTAPDLTHLRNLAEVATPGPWRALPDDHWNCTAVHWDNIDADDDGHAHDYGYDVCHVDDSKRPDEDAKFIAAFSPDTAIALLDRLDAANKKIANWSGAASFGDGSPCYTPDRLQESIKALLDRAAELEEKLRVRTAELKAKDQACDSWVRIAARAQNERDRMTEALKAARKSILRFPGSAHDAAMKKIDAALVPHTRGDDQHG